MDTQKRPLDLDLLLIGLAKSYFYLLVVVYCSFFVNSQRWFLTFTQQILLCTINPCPKPPFTGQIQNSTVELMKNDLHKSQVWAKEGRSAFLRWLWHLQTIICFRHAKNSKCFLTMFTTVYPVISILPLPSMLRKYPQDTSNYNSCTISTQGWCPLNLHNYPFPPNSFFLLSSNSTPGQESGSEKRKQLAVGEQPRTQMWEFCPTVPCVLTMLQNTVGNQSRLLKEGISQRQESGERELYSLTSLVPRTKLAGFHSPCGWKGSLSSTGMSEPQEEGAGPAGKYTTNAQLFKYATPDSLHKKKQVTLFFKHLISHTYFSGLLYKYGLPLSFKRCHQL